MLRHADHDGSAHNKYVILSAAKDLRSQEPFKSQC